MSFQAVRVIAGTIAIVERRYQVFLSSTYRDLEKERQEVIQALLELDCIPAGMEMFPAASEDQWTLIKEVIDLSDYYVVVLGGKYGSMTAEGISYTEKEYDYAVERNMQVLGFVPEDPNSLTKDKIELDPAVREKLEAFQSKVMSRPIKKYRGPDDLGAVVSRALNAAMRKSPQEGWVRARFAMTPEVDKEIAELREQVAEAEVARLKSGKPSSEDTSVFKQGDSPLNLAFHVGSRNYNVNTDIRLLALLTWDEVVREIGPKMIDEAAEEDIRDRLAIHLLYGAKWDEDGEQRREDVGKIPNPNPVIFIDEWERVIVQLRAIGLIDKGVKRRQVRDSNTYFRLTDKGDRHLVRLLAERNDQQALFSE